jgi:integrase
MMGRRRRRNRRLVLASRAKTTQTRYLKGVLSFLQWCVREGVRFDTVGCLDELMCDYFHYVLDENLGKTAAKMCYYGMVMLLPEFRLRLPVSLASLKGFESLFPSVSYPPMSWDLACLVAMNLVAAGCFDCAVAVILAFECLFRISEVVNIKVSDIADSRDPRIGYFFDKVAVALPNTKTGKNKWAELTSPDAVTLLRNYVKGRRPSDRLFNFSADTLRKRFKRACRAVGLTAPYVFHSLRHGGATHRYLSGEHLEDILRHGRWVSSKSARLYIQSGRALLLAVNVSPQVLSSARLMSTYCVAYLSSLALSQ